MAPPFLRQANAWFRQLIMIRIADGEIFSSRVSWKFNKGDAASGLPDFYGRGWNM